MESVNQRRNKSKEEKAREGENLGESHLTPQPEWVVLAAKLFGSPSVTNCVDHMNKKICQGALRNMKLSTNIEKTKVSKRLHPTFLETASTLFRCLTTKSLPYLQVIFYSFKKNANQSHCPPRSHILTLA